MATKIINRHFDREDVFEVVNEWPAGGYSVWNIGRSNFPHPGYIPLCQKGDYPYVNLVTLKALHVGNEALCLEILKEAGYHGCDEARFNEIKSRFA